jgi:hypothetical protein
LSGLTKLKEIENSAPYEKKKIQFERPKRILIAIAKQSFGHDGIN